MADRVNVIENMYLNDCLWLKFDSSVIDNEFALGAEYMLCEGSKYYYNKAFEELENDIVQLKSLYDIPLCMMGDPLV